MIEIMPLSEDDGAEPGRVTRSQLISVIRQRVDLLLGDIGARLTDMGFAGPGGRQGVPCGGGAELKGNADFAQGVLGRSVGLVERRVGEVCMSRCRFRGSP